MQIKTKKIKIRTQKAPQFIDITDRVFSFVNSAGIKNGLVSIFSSHTTAAIKINENDPLLIKDMEIFLRKIAPKGEFYHHKDNGNSHCQHLLLSTCESRPLIEGKIDIGQWQRVFLVELDRGREREVILHIIGE